MDGEKIKARHQEEKQSQFFQCQEVKVGQEWEEYMVRLTTGSTTATTIFYLCPEMFTIDKYIQREKLTIKK